MEYNEFMCQVFMENPSGGELLPVTGGGLIGGEKECREYGKNAIGNDVRYWHNEKEDKIKCVAFKIWKRIL